MEREGGVDYEQIASDNSDVKESFNALLFAKVVHKNV